jgi:hypothetical protein
MSGRGNNIQSIFPVEELFFESSRSERESFKRLGTVDSLKFHRRFRIKGN